MSYTVATLPKGYAIAFASDDMAKVVKAHGFTQLLDIEEKTGWEEAVLEVERRNEEIELKRNSSLVIVSQGRRSIVNCDGDMNQILAAVTKFICESLNKGNISFAQADRMIDLVMQHMDNLAEIQTKTFKDLSSVEEEQNYEVYDDDERV